MSPYFKSALLAIFLGLVAALLLAEACGVLRK